MMPDLAFLLSALNAPAGIAAPATSGGQPGAVGATIIALTAAGSPVAPPGLSVATPVTTTASAFQAALAAQVTPIAPSASNSSVPSAAPDSTALVPDIQPAMSVAPGASAQPAKTLALAPGSTRPPAAKLPAVPAITPNSTEHSSAATALAGPKPVLPVEVAVEPAPAAQMPAAISSAPAAADGKLPKYGKQLPPAALFSTPAAAAQPKITFKPGEVPEDIADDGSDDGSQDGSDGQTINPVIAVDPSAQPLTALMGVVAPSVPPVTDQRPASGKSPTSSTSAALAPTAVPMAARPAAIGTLPPLPIAAATGSPPAAPAPAIETTPASRAAIPTPQPTAPATSVTPLPLPLAAAAAPAPAAPTALPPVVPTAETIVLQQPVAIAAAAPVIANAIPAGPPPASLSTASRLARQPGAPRSTNADMTSDAGTAVSPPAIAAPATAQLDAPVTTANLPAATPPQDFGALVDRLLEARATAQGSAAPQQVSTSVTHGDFGKVSLTFQQDPAGLSVSMTSADPGFARAAQSAMTATGPSSAAQPVTPGPLPGGHAGRQDPAADPALAGGMSQIVAKADIPPPANPGASGQGTGFSSAGGGAQQSQAQAQAQPQPQAQQRPGVNAANKAPGAAGSAASDGKPQGIFA